MELRQPEQVEEHQQPENQPEVNHPERRLSFKERMEGLFKKYGKEMEEPYDK